MSYDDFCTIIYNELKNVGIVNSDYEIFCITNKLFLLPYYAQGGDPNEIVDDLINTYMTLL